ncbi:MAG: ABC-F family ATP-binding cassette domain-containing protein [Tissierellia bacterium]|nr:ABC-F family ATP-binding cassette domain-containing protein [Tissierellia bacterium]
MQLIQAKDLQFIYVVDPIFQDVSFVINEGDKIGLVGDNGSGKSTLMKCLAGLLVPKGNFYQRAEIRISYLRQQVEMDVDCTVMEMALSKYDHIQEMEQQLRALEQDMATYAEDEEKLAPIMDSYQRLHDTFEELQGYGFQSELKGYLAMVGMDESFYEKTVRNLSGGEKARLELALVFMEKPDLLLLDEPTNHMDMEMIAYLERFLKEFRGTVLFISHDRLLLQNIATRIFEMSHGTLKSYDMGYDAYRKTVQRERELQQKHYEDFKKEEQRQKEIIRRFRSYATERYYRLAKSREKMLEKMRQETPPLKESSIRFQFKEPLRTGREVLKVRELKKSFDDTTLFQDLDFSIQAQDRLAIVGPNGCGKTTLVKILMGELPYEGEYLWGTGVKLGYFNQQLTVIDEENTLIEEISDEFPSMNIHQIRNLLAGFLFTGEDVFKELRTLSGGQRARISLLKLILHGANVLILDEPTNHLDLTSKEVLEDALKAFKGTLLFISHDRFFIDTIANRVLDLSERRIYEGDFSYYCRKKSEGDGGEPSVEVSRTEQKKQQAKKREAIRKSQALNKQITSIEKTIAELESALEEIDGILETSELYENPQEALQWAKKREEISSSLEHHLEEWEALHLDL